MSANNVVWCMFYEENYHVFYSGCIDNTPTKPDYKDKHYGIFFTRGGALVYAHDVVSKIDELSLQEGFIGVEYGVCEIMVEKVKREEPDSIKVRVKRLEEQLISKENRIKERLCILEDNMNLEAGNGGGCYQFTYCNECLAFPMGLGCTNKNKEEY